MPDDDFHATSRVKPIKLHDTPSGNLSSPSHCLPDLVHHHTSAWTISTTPRGDAYSLLSIDCIQPESRRAPRDGCGVYRGSHSGHLSHEIHGPSRLLSQNCVGQRPLQFFFELLVASTYTENHYKRVLSTTATGPSNVSTTRWRGCFPWLSTNTKTTGMCTFRT